MGAQQPVLIQRGQGRRGVAERRGLADPYRCGMQAHYDAEIAREQLAMELATIERMA